MQPNRASCGAPAATVMLPWAFAPTDKGPDAGSDAGSETSASDARSTPSTGSIRGAITYSGDPRPQVLDRSKDPACTTVGSEPRYEGWFVGGEEAGCEFAPRVFAVRAGTTLEFKNLPPGRYVVQAWHERFSDPLRRTVEVEAGESTVIGRTGFPFGVEAPGDRPRPK